MRQWLSRFYIRVDWPLSWDGPTWFNLSGPHVSLYTPFGSLAVQPWNVFNRRCADGSHYWGVGILQVGHRHLGAVMFSGVSIGFIGRIP